MKIDISLCDPRLDGIEKKIDLLVRREASRNVFIDNCTRRLRVAREKLAASVAAAGGGTPPKP